LALQPGCQGRAPEISSANLMPATDPATHIKPANAKLAEPPVPVQQQALLKKWFGTVGQRHKVEPFGALIIRAARAQLQKPYRDPPQDDKPEHLAVEIDSFQCVSFVESSLAIARCAWADTPNQACYLHELTSSRYRDGRLNGYASRLHYFTDWIDDNARRHRISELSATLGGQPSHYEFDFMSQHSALYPALTHPETLASLVQTEQRLSAEPHSIIPRDAVRKHESKLQSGDVVAIVSNKHPGLLVRHTGFIDTTNPKIVRLLHASSSHGRVLLTAGDIADYMQGRPDRLGMMVARPQPPPQNQVVANSVEAGR